MQLVPVIGLETHVQLKTASKMFCRCPVLDGAVPNVNICPVCLGHPGALPSVNTQAVKLGILLAHALSGRIATSTHFDRKNYFYPDLPKAYQISQYDVPLMEDGFLDVDVPGGSTAPKRIRIERMHLEEDAGKNIHAPDGSTLVDFNRGGVALAEIVTRPDLASSAEAKAYLGELRLLLRTLDVSGGDMEKGQLRCDVNVSLREADARGAPTGPLMPKTEVKNVNSFRAVERAILFEVRRQTKLWESGQPPMKTTTRGWNDRTQETEEQRTKEDSADYRYFPEPDVPPLDLARMIEATKTRLPELPRAKRSRFKVEYGFKDADVRMMVEDPDLADFAERAMSELSAWLEAKPDVTPEMMESERKKLVRTFAGWLLTKLLGLLAERGKNISEANITPENFAEFVMLVGDGKITGTKGLEVLGRMLDAGSGPEDAARTLGAARLDDPHALEAVVANILRDHPETVTRYKAGETKLLQFFLGQVMQATHGNADPSSATRALKEVLDRT